jgi:xylan 1,4-beta-xylosidase
LATIGVDKPVLNVFRMFGMMSGDRVEVTGDFSYDYLMVRDSSVRGDQPDINALAAVDGSKATVMVWNYHDLNVMQDPVNVDLLVKGIEASTVKLDHYRIDKEHSNSYQLWMQMGSPQDVTADQYAQLELAGKLHQVSSTPSIGVVDGTLSIPVNMESQSVSLFVINGQ